MLWKMVEAFAEMKKEDGLNIKIAIYTADAPREHYKRGELFYCLNPEKTEFGCEEDGKLIFLLSAQNYESTAYIVF